VVIDVAGNVTITHSSGVDVVHSLLSNNPIILAGGTLTVNGSVQLNNPLTLAGGTLANATVNESGAGKLVLTSNGGTLSGVTVNGDLDLSQVNGAYLTVYNGLTLNGMMYLGNASGSTFGRVYFGGTSMAPGTLGGNATVVFGGTNQSALYNASNVSGSAGTLTIATGVTVHGKSGVIGAGSIVNQGTISADVSGGSITVGPAFTNRGALSAVNGGGLTLSGSWTNAAGSTIAATSATLTLGAGLFLWSNAGTITATNSTVNIGGTFTQA
jgi:hypothetical protein